MWTDTHAHLDAFVESQALDAALERAAAAGVARIVAIGGDPASNARALALAAAHRGRIWAAIGHDRALALSPPPLHDLRAQLAAGAGVAAVGEVGLDYYHDASNAAAQRALFEAMLEEAAAHSLPVVVHSRAAEADTCAMLAAHARDSRVATGRVGVLHCFTGGWKFARALLDLGLYLGVSGIVTFRNAEEIRDVVRRAPADRLLLETDCPYLAPAPMRGRPNEPAFLAHTGKFVAELRGTTSEELAAMTSRNAERLFGLPTSADSTASAPASSLGTDPSFRCPGK